MNHRVDCLLWNWRLYVQTVEAVFLENSSKLRNNDCDDDDDDDDECVDNRS